MNLYFGEKKHCPLFQRIRELRSTLENGTITITSNEDVNEQVNNSITSLPEHDSGLSENESSQTTTESISSKTKTSFQPLSASSDVESGISSDYSPSGRPSSSTLVFRHQSSTEMNDIPTIERLALELNSIALDWRSYQAPLHCSCALPFDSAQRKVCRIELSHK